MKIFVGGLAWSTTDASLRAAFEHFGPVTEATVVKDKETGRSRGFGFVAFASREHGQVALEKMNGASLDGRTIRCDEAVDRPRGGPPPGRPQQGYDRGPPRFDDRGPPRFDDRGPPRGDDRGPPRFDDRGPPRPQQGFDRGPPRFDDRGPPRGDDRGPPRPQQGFDRGPPRPQQGFDRGPPPRPFDGPPRPAPGFDRGPPPRPFDNPPADRPPRRFDGPPPARPGDDDRRRKKGKVRRDREGAPEERAGQVAKGPKKGRREDLFYDDDDGYGDE